MSSLYIAAVATLVSSIIASTVAIIVNSKTLRTQEMNALRNQLDKMIDISIEYPYLEDDIFCKNWSSKKKPSLKAMRYENYCCFVFNLLERVWSHFAGNKREIEKWLYVKEIVKKHRAWWRADINNTDSYEASFRDYVNSFIEDEK